MGYYLLKAEQFGNAGSATLLAIQEPLAFGLDALGLATVESRHGLADLLLQDGIHKGAGALLIFQAATLATGELGALETDRSH